MRLSLAVTPSVSPATLVRTSFNAMSAATATKPRAATPVTVGADRFGWTDSGVSGVDGLGGSSANADSGSASWHQESSSIVFGRFFAATAYPPNEYSTTRDGVTFAVRPVDVNDRRTLADTSHVCATFHLMLPTASAR